MDGGQRPSSVGGHERRAPFLHQPELRSEERLRGRRAETDDQRRTDGFELRLEPGTAGDELRHARLLVDASLAARLPFEMLDGVRKVDLRAVDAGLAQRLIQDGPSGSDERSSGTILLIARLLTDEHERRRL